MPYCFGSDASDDVRWQRFLQTPLLSQRERSAWLLSGFSPPHGSQQPPPALAPIDEGRWAALQASLVEDLPIPWQFGQYQQPVCLVHRGEAAYPLRLAECADAPPALFCVGDNRLLSHPGIAVVGSRRPSRDGARAAFTLGSDLAMGGLVTISGLARGIDGQAHEGALSVGGASVAVMATGIDQVYPREHHSLAQRIAETGLLVTEFLPGSLPNRWHFPRRNHTLSGLSIATVVVEAGRPSGSLITAGAAADQGRDVFAYPWSVYHSGGEGCRHLLADGAQLAQSAQDIFASLGLPTQPPAGQHASGKLRPMPEQAPLSARSHVSKEALTIMEIIGDATIDLPELVALSGLSGVELRRELSQLELLGCIDSTPMGFRLNRDQSPLNPC